jgi:hypothetical protein
MHQASREDRIRAVMCVLSQPISTRQLPPSNRLPYDLARQLAEQAVDELAAEDAKAAALSGARPHNSVGPWSS